MRHRFSASDTYTGSPFALRVLFRAGLAAVIAIAISGGTAPFTAEPAFALNHYIKVSRMTPSSTARRGNTSGPLFNQTCLEGMVLIGIEARAGSLVDSVRGICSRITSTGNWTGATSRTGRAGGGGGSTRTRMCPQNYAISGFSGRSGTFIDRLQFECSRLGSNGTITTQRQVLPSVGGSGGSAFSTTRCSRPARAMVGTASAYIHSFELACETNSPVMTTSQINNALSGATNILRTDSGASDVSCDTRLYRSGRVNIEPSNGMWNISSGSEMNRACGLPGFAVVTSRITYCSGFGSNIVGCARPGCMVMVPGVAAGAATSQLWAHEFGHTRALGHRDGTGNIMNSSINNGGRLNNAECGAFNNPVTNFFFSFLPAEEHDLSSMSLDEFAEKQFFHGVPYEAAEVYGKKAVPELIKMLRDTNQAEKWSNAATLLAMLDDPRGVDAVIDFIDKVDAGDQNSLPARARANAVLSLGYSAAKGKNPKSMRYLMDSLEDDAWQKRGVRNARGLRTGAEPDMEIEEGVDEELTEYAVAGLALSGQPAAEPRLREFANANGRSAEMKNFVETALFEHAQVRKVGLARYDQDRRARALERSQAEERKRSGQALERPGRQPEREEEAADERPGNAPSNNARPRQ